MNDNKWWKNAIIYQIYPKSFKDSNNDGIGDLKGIIEKLDYLSFLGVDAIWLSPIYDSPMEDNGYDVADYFKIAPIFGTMEDMDSLISEAKKRNIRIIMDLVANHTSKEHVWFKEACKSIDNPYHDYFYWSDKPDDKISDFCGSSWEYVESLNLYYYHYFAKGQVDLNWTNPKVRQEIANIINWWLDKGVAGFRMDAIELIGKELDKNIFANGPKIHDYLRELNENSFGKKKDSITVGEGWPTTKIAIEYTNPEHHELDMMFNFDLISHIWKNNDLEKFEPNIPNLIELKKIFARWQNDLKDKGWNTLFWENHDLARCISNFGNDRFYREESAKALAYMLYFQQGTPFIYQGQEIGMINAYYTKLSDYQDIDSINKYQDKVIDKKIVSSSRMLKGLQRGSRDNARTPIPWNDKENAGWNNGATPWLKIIPNYKEINIEKAIANKDSVLYTYKDIFKFRKESEYRDTIINGSYETYLDDDPYIYVYKRSYNDKSFIVVVNYDDDNHELDLNIDVSNIIMSSYKDSPSSTRKVILRPYEAIVYKIK
ncbi:MAG: alpha-glucosidase [Erysipelotrichaceae bacterium]|nr:alpha-glucosidase [Erysipelotrichaceae bacterium]